MAKKLGKGLDALLSEPTNSNEFINNQDNRLIMLDPKLLKPNPHQPRTSFSDQALNELSISIKNHGLLQPVLVQKDENGNFFIIAGERRTRASILAGLNEIPVLLTNIEENQKLEVALIENIQRENLNPIEEAKAYKNIISLGNLTQESLSERIGKSRSAIANTLRFLQLPDEIQKALEKGEISAGHAKAILSLNSDSEQKALFQKIKQEGLSVRLTEVSAKDLSKNSIKKATSKTTSLNPDNIALKDIEQQFIDALGTKVSVKGSLKKGTVEISYFSADDLQSLYEKIKD